VNSATVLAARMVLIYVIGACAVKIFFYFPEMLSAAGVVVGVRQVGMVSMGGQFRGRPYLVDGKVSASGR